MPIEPEMAEFFFGFQAQELTVWWAHETCAIFGSDRGEGNDGKKEEYEEFSNHGLVITIVIYYYRQNV